MPIPRVICCICGQEINKAQTLHIGGGKRACRSHKNTAEASAHEREKITQQKQAEIDKIARTKENKRREREPFTLEPHCLICGKKGMRQEEWYTRLMIEMKKYEITHGKPINPFAGDMKKAAGALANITCIFYVIWHGKNTKVKLPFDVYEFTQTQKSLGIEEPVLMLCRDCIREKGFTSLSEERSEQALESGDFFLLAGLIHAIVEPEITKTAIQEITASN